MQSQGLAHMNVFVYSMFPSPGSSKPNLSFHNMRVGVRVVCMVGL